MKTLLLIGLLALTACDFMDLMPSQIRGAKFKVGDCIVTKINLEEYRNRESWETKKFLYAEKVLKVGKNKYRTAAVVNDSMVMYSNTSIILDRYYQKIECPNILKFRSFNEQ